MELTTHIIIGIAFLLLMGVLIYLGKDLMTITKKTNTEQLTTTNDIESFLDIDLDILLSETHTKPTNVQELKKKLNQFKNRNKFYNL